jgi:superfamily II DNA/RNA helicase
MLADAYRKRGIDPKTVSEEMRTDIERRVHAAQQQKALIRIGYLRRIIGRAKVAPALNWLGRIARREPVVVFAEHRAVLQNIVSGLTTMGIKNGLMIGGMASNDERTRLIDAFQSGKIQVLVCSLQVASVGVTLTRGRHTLFVERPWNPAIEDQAEDRTHRITQTSVTHMWRLHVEDTIDDRHEEIMTTKRDLIRETVRSVVIANEVKRDILRSFMARPPVRTSSSQATPRFDMFRIQSVNGPGAGVYRRPIQRDRIIEVRFPKKWGGTKATSWARQNKIRPLRQEYREGRICYVLRETKSKNLTVRRSGEVELLYRSR